jgi:hypothetical protein
MMQRLAIAWKMHGLDFDIFDLGGLAELIIPEELKEPVPTTESSPARRNIAVVHAFLQGNFDLASMTVDGPK